MAEGEPARISAMHCQWAQWKTNQHFRRIPAPLTAATTRDKRHCAPPWKEPAEDEADDTGRGEMRMIERTTCCPTLNDFTYEIMVRTSSGCPVHSSKNIVLPVRQVVCVDGYLLCNKLATSTFRAAYKTYMCTFENMDVSIFISCLIEWGVGNDKRRAYEQEYQSGTVQGKVLWIKHPSIIQLAWMQRWWRACTRRISALDRSILCHVWKCLRPLCAEQFRNLAVPQHCSCCGLDPDAA